MNTPELRTDRLILRKFTENDISALYLILKDREVNRFLPWFPVNHPDEAKLFFEEHYAAKYSEKRAYAYAICLREDNIPIGYIGVEPEEPHDMGYGLRKEFWRLGIITEAGRAVMEQVRIDGLPYITATHDRNNPASGKVMQKLGMKYRYSYSEQWQPKNIPVIFRMYQLNFDGSDNAVYNGYRERYGGCFIEETKENPDSP